jgi:lon-related putative ATP-dependent protease
MDEARPQLELGPEQLRRLTDPARLNFETTQELPPPQAMVGQNRAQEAIEFALEMPDGRYNLFVVGQPGTGRRIAVTSAVERIAKGRPAAQDWCYVHNFEQSDEPRAVALPPGLGHTFAHDVEAFIRGCRKALRSAFGSETYEQQRTALVAGIGARHSALVEEMQQEALALGFLIRPTETGLAILPLRPSASGQPQDTEEGAAKQEAPASEPEAQSGEAAEDAGPQAISREELAALPEEVQQQLRENQEKVDQVITRTLPQLHTLEEEARAFVRTLDHEFAEKALAGLADDLNQRYTVSADALDFLRHLRADIVAQADVLREGEDIPEGTVSDGDGEAVASEATEPAQVERDEATAGAETNRRPVLVALLHQYSVNVLVSHKPEESAPVVEELNPARGNLLGRIEYGLRNGLPFTDHTMIKAGALHRANGGFLIVQAYDLLNASRSWEAVKRVLRFATIAMETGGEASGSPTSATLRPEPIPANVKVILIGDSATYRALLELDQEFRLLFKVRADFDDEMPRDAEAELAYARFAGEVARSTGSPPLTRGAVALVIEEGSRWAEDQERLSTLFGDLRDLTLEACFWAKKESAVAATREHVAHAVVSRERRQSLLSDKLDDLIRRGTVMIDTDGQVVGQVNGLSVLSTSDFAFGKPTRITARTSPGLAGVLDIERETQLSGPSHSKGILILQGYLAGRFAQDFPLSLTASVCFEQTYDEVDGDSASTTELYALLSSLSGVPIRQWLAVTGSVNQRGEVQAVGGVTLKIEAFFKTCAARGLNGKQGVIIPRANVRSLMLRQDVLDAVRAGQFHIYAVSTVDEGIELLTGIPGGRPDNDGRYLAGTINARVSQTLQAYSERVRAFTGAPTYATKPVR